VIPSLIFSSPKRFCRQLQSLPPEARYVCAAPRQVILEEGLDIPIIGRPALDEIGFSAAQHFSAVRDTYNMHEFSHVSQELTEMADKPTGALARLLLKPTGSPSEIKDWIAADPSLAECDYEMPQLVSDSEDEDDCKTHKPRLDGGIQMDSSMAVIAAIKQQYLFYGDIPDDDPIDYRDVDVLEGDTKEVSAAVQ
jgi:hypothetical protein